MQTVETEVVVQLPYEAPEVHSYSEAELLETVEAVPPGSQGP